MLKTENLWKVFGGIEAVRDVSLDIDFESGNITLLIGPNGAGKTTFFNLLTGLNTPTNGKVLFESEEITDMPPHKRVEKGMARTFQIAKLFPKLSVGENIKIGIQRFHHLDEGGILSHFREGRLDELRDNIINRLNIEEIRDKPVENLSHGWLRYLEVGLAYTLDPKVLLLDEPLAGLSETEIRFMKDFLNEIRKKIPILLIEHKLSSVIDLASRVIVLHEGEILADGKAQEIRESEEVQEAYLKGSL